MKLFFTLLFTSLFAAMSAQTIYVKSNAVGANNGTSWSNAYNSLGLALINATNGAQVWVAKGTYLPDRDSLGNLTPSNNRLKTFRLKSGVSLYGGFVGTETQLTQRDPSVNSTILSGDIGVANSSTDNAYHVVLVRNLSMATRLDGFTVKEGAADAFSVAEASGAGFYVLNARNFLTIVNCTILNNKSNTCGGAVFCDTLSGLTALKSLFQNNASGCAGGIYCSSVFRRDELSFNLTDCTFDKNHGTESGAIWTNLKLKGVNCIFKENYAIATEYRDPFSGITLKYGGSGGGIYISNDIDLTDCAFYNNWVSTFIDWYLIKGAAICQDTGNMTLQSCGFLGNNFYMPSPTSLGRGVGVVTGGEGMCTINNCLFYKNFAYGGNLVIGGGIAYSNKTATISNSLFVDNFTNSPSPPNLYLGGGISASKSNSMILNCTFSGNRVSNGDNSGAMLLGDAAYTTTIKNTIMWNNATLPTTEQMATNTMATISYSLIQGGVPMSVTNGGNNISADPLFVNATSLFGANQSWPDADDGFMLQANSPAASSGTLVGVPLQDVLGVTKPSNPSMGLYQRSGAVPVTLIDFYGKTTDLGNILSWQTATEVNNEGFDVERSADGKAFEKIGFAASKGMNSVYSFTDDTPLSISYYRLRQKDLDGKTTLSKVISLNKSNNTAVKLFPNPMHNRLKIVFDNSENTAFKDGQISIFDLRGQLILTKTSVLTDSDIDVSDLPNGMYIIQIQRNQDVFRQKIVKN